MSSGSGLEGTFRCANLSTTDNLSSDYINNYNNDLCNGDVIVAIS